jgi:hypothetical protein
MREGREETICGREMKRRVVMRERGEERRKRK